MNDEKRRQRRTFLEIENDIMEATRQLIEENGISNLSLRGVARKAGIEFSVFYNRYKDLTDLLQKFTEKYDYWYDEIITSFGNIDSANYPEYSKEVFVSLIGALKKNESMQQIVLWELMEDNYITRRTNQMREQYTEHITEAFQLYFEKNNLTTDPRVISGIFISAIYFLVIHKGLATFCGVDYGTPQGLDMLADGIRDILDKVYAENTASDKMQEVAKKMKANGIADAVIAECTDLPLEAIEQLTT
ncbi:MAG: TetR/AcrR family transcriptional regulator [Dysgonomonas sp.]